MIKSHILYMPIYAWRGAEYFSPPNSIYSYCNKIFQCIELENGISDDLETPNSHFFLARRQP